jgi:hypothetical protein
MKTLLSEVRGLADVKQGIGTKTSTSLSEKGKYQSSFHLSFCSNTRESRYIFTLEGKDTTISASDPQPVHIPARARHTFKVDDTCDGPCTIEISTSTSPRSVSEDPEAEGATSKFFRNVYSYLDDCYIQNVSPSLPQLLMMLDSAEISMAFPGPGFIARPASYAFGVVFGRWLGGFLGYQSSYPEYWNGNVRKTK